MGDSTQFDLGRFEESIDALKRGQDEMRSEIHELRSETTEMKLAFASARGGWKALLTFGGLVGGVVGFMSDTITNFFRGH